MFLYTEIKGRKRSTQPSQITFNSRSDFFATVNAADLKYLISSNAMFY